MTDVPAIREALSWSIVAAFARRHPEVEVHRSLLPEGVGYDTLVLHHGDEQLALLNRGGRAHVHDDAVEWEAVVKLGVYAMVERIESANIRPFVGKRPPTTPRVLTYRTISSLVSNEVFGMSAPPTLERRPITVEPCHWDNSWDDSPADWVSDFPEINRRVDRAQCSHHFWHVRSREISIALDANSGEAWPRQGDRLDLPAAYSAAGRAFEKYIHGVLEVAQTPPNLSVTDGSDAVDLLTTRLANHGIAAPPVGAPSRASVRLLEQSATGDHTHIRVGTTDIHAWGVWDGDFEYVYQPLLDGHHFFAQAGQLMFLLASAGPLAVWTTHHLDVDGETAIENADAINRSWVRVRALLNAAGREPTARPTRLLMLSGDAQYGVIDLDEVRRTGGLSEVAYTRCHSEEDVLQFGAELLRNPVPALNAATVEEVTPRQRPEDRHRRSAAHWGPVPLHDGEDTPFTYRCDYDSRNWNRGLFEDPMFRLDLLTLVEKARSNFSITFAGGGGTPVWISGARSRGRLALETGYDVPGRLRKPVRGGVGELLALGWKVPADATLGGFTAVLPDTDPIGAVDLILGTFQCSAYGQLHTIWRVWPKSLSSIVAAAQEARSRTLPERPLAGASAEQPLKQPEDDAPSEAGSTEVGPSAVSALTGVLWHERVGQIETVLSFFGEQFAIEVAREDGVTVYVQGRRTGGGSAIEVEAVSNEFLPEGAQLSLAHISLMDELGWDMPAVPYQPNFCITVYDATEEALHNLSTVIAKSLAWAYGVQCDDEWTVTPAEFGSTIGDLVDPGLFDIFSEGPWFNWAWKSASSYTRLPFAGHDVLIFVLGIAKSRAHTGPYRDGTTGPLGLPNVAGAELMNSEDTVVARVTDEFFAVRLPAEWAVAHLASVTDAVNATIRGNGFVFGAADPGFLEVELQLPDANDSAAVSAWILDARDLTLKAVLGAGQSD